MPSSSGADFHKPHCELRNKTLMGLLMCVRVQRNPGSPTWRTFRRTHPLRKPRSEYPMPCTHVPPCPEALAVDRDAAQVVASYPEQGWSLLCNGVILFEDTGELLPDGR